MTENNYICFNELADAVIAQLKEQHYMDSTLTVYKRTYRRIREFMERQGVQEYFPDIGQEFIGSQTVQLSTISAYKCAVRRLNDCYSGTGYRFHRDNPSEGVCTKYQELLNDYLNECIKNGNKSGTIVHKNFACVTFLNFLAENGYEDISLINADIISKALLLFTNKDRYADVRRFLRYLYEKEQIKQDYSEMIPRSRRPKPIPTVYTVDEIRRIENSIDVSTDTGMRNICIIRLATRMGLRSGDIARLKINEIDFTSGNIKIIQEKTGLPLELQMPPEVYGSIYLHLENQRKNHYADDDVFHSMTAPYGRVTTGIIRHIVNECIKLAKIEINGRKHGPHAFRSSLASSMINDDSSYEIVRKILGHSDPNVIKHYAKTDTEKLRLCAIDPPEPRGLFNEYLSGKKVFAHV